MGKSVKERLDETIKRDKQEIAEEDNKMEIKGNKETNVEDFMNKKIKEMIDDKEQKLEEDEDDEFEEEIEERSHNEKKIIVTLIVLIISLSTILALWSNGYEIVNFAFNKVNEINDSKNSKKENEVIENENVAVVPMDLTQCYQKVHHMANTIIIADDGQIWGQNEITREAVTQIVNEVKGQDDYLSDQLKKWLELDFSNGVEIHNYVWNKLGGNIGKARELNEEKVEQVIKAMTE